MYNMCVHFYSLHEYWHDAVDEDNNEDWHWFQGRSLREGTVRRMHRHSFAAASFLEEDTVDFPDELDTSFFSKVKWTTNPGIYSPHHLNAAT